MSQQEALEITNNCNDTITVFFRYPRPKKQIERPNSVILHPGQKTHPIPVHLLVGSRGWEKLKSRECVKIESVAYEARYVRLLNRTKEVVLSFNIRLAAKLAKKAKTTIELKPGQRSRSVQVSSISQRRRLDNLVKEKQVEILPVYDIGPSTGRGRSVASYADEDVYTCYKCGGPIVFRGSPPTPVHI
jgi:hypothetical protein